MSPIGKTLSMTPWHRKNQKPELSVARLRSTEAMLHAVKDVAAALQALESNEATSSR
jgi:hypothetical protein